ncbi:hypothetical protein Tco_0720352 [Tanacetum coccineum]
MPKVDIEVVVKQKDQHVAATTVVEPNQEIIIIDLDSSSDELEFSSLEKIVSNKGPSKQLLNWYENENNEKQDDKDKEEDEKDEEEEDEL